MDQKAGTKENGGKREAVQSDVFKITPYHTHTSPPAAIQAFVIGLPIFFAIVTGTISWEVLLQFQALGDKCMSDDVKVIFQHIRWQFYYLTV